MNVAILVPHRGDDGPRSRNWEAVQQQVVWAARQLGAYVAVADSGPGTFSIAKAWNNAAIAAGQAMAWDKAIMWGSDFWLVRPMRQLTAALAMDDPFVFAFNTVSTLNEAQTRRVWEGTWQEMHVPRSNVPFGGVRVITRELWDQTGGYDERFVGWGHEDRAWRKVISLLYGRHDHPRVPGRMWNLWHPKQTPGDPYYEARHANHMLLAEYKSLRDEDDLVAYRHRLYADTNGAPSE